MTVADAADDDASQPNLALRVEFPQDCLAGTFVSGRVYLVLPKSDESSNFHWQGMHVRLEGHEFATVGLSSAGGATMVEKKNPLILTEQPIVTWSLSPANHPDTKSSKQHLEYPFRWRLPANLPASMHCRKRKTKEQCRIEYTMSAFLISRVGEKIYNSTVGLQVRSHAVAATQQGQSGELHVPVETFSIVTALVFAKGSIDFGLKLSTDVIHPGANLRIGVYGSNQSKVAVKDFVVRLVERVTWTMKKDSADHTISDERILSENKIWTHGAADWQGGGCDRRLMEHQTLWNILRVPERGCRNTYFGEWIRVEHFVLVIAETAVDKTTNPRRKYPIRLVNASRADQMLQQQNAIVLPTNWEPMVAQVMEIPDTLVVPQAQACIVPTPRVPNNNDDSSTPGITAHEFEQINL
mmetsp:Transcript_8393/g.16004  ORF Transcript_8393/g.16004 Transcript_8393/m.16004 type:complete len:411 (+) Transcript_8393:119-1351(+)|eukprot:scaffold10892_cov163-Amphora_coffeaeformis.AAC.3